MTRIRIEAVVFDVDGTLIRSVEQHAEAYRMTMAPLGIDVEPMEIFLREGARSESIIRELLERDGHDLEDDRIKALSNQKQAHYEDLGVPEPYPGGLETVQAIRERGFQLGLVTGTRRRNVDRLLPDVAPVCDVIRAQEDYSRDKPDPEPYASAIEALELEPETVLVLENAPRGVESAHRAGAQVAAITTTLPAERLSEHADWVVDSYDEFLELVPVGPGGVVRATADE